MFVKLPTRTPSDLAVPTHAQWPAMRRVQLDHLAVIDAKESTVWRWWARPEDTWRYLCRCGQLPHPRCTEAGSRHHGQGWVGSDYVPGTHPRDPRVVLRVLETIHSSRERIYDSEGVWGHRCLESRIARMRENHPDDAATLGMIYRWRGWQELRGRIGPWHGDPTLSNCIVHEITKQAWLIDHALEPSGPLEYDIAKLRRSCIISDDAEWIDDPRHYRGDRWLACALAGMIGSHAVGRLRDMCIEAFREVTEG